MAREKKRSRNIYICGRGKFIRKRAIMLIGTYKRNHTRLKMSFFEEHTKGEHEWLSDLRQTYKTQDTSLINYFFDKILNIEPSWSKFCQKSNLLERGRVGGWYPGFCMAIHVPLLHVLQRRTFLIL